MFLKQTFKPKQPDLLTQQNQTFMHESTDICAKVVRKSVFLAKLQGFML